MRGTGGRSSSAPIFLAVLIVVLATVAGSTGTLTNAGSPEPNSLSHSWAPMLAIRAIAEPTIGDDQTLNVTSPASSELTDSVSYAGGEGGTRAYWVNLTASTPIPSTNVTLTTLPLVQWGDPGQFPNGPDELPPLALWNWKVVKDGANDSPSWSETAGSGKLSRTIDWSNQSYEVLGSTGPVISVAVNLSRSGGTITPGAGFVVNTPGVTGGIPVNDSDFSDLVTSLHPSIIRISTLLTDALRSWNTMTNQPAYNFSYFDQWVTIAQSLHAMIYLSIPAGSWGDGNVLPAGMPVNSSLVVKASSGNGYFPQDQAWREWVEGLVNHTVATGANITYWNVGNEVPTYNASEVAGFTNVFNIAEGLIAAQLPGALVGSDVMMDQTYESYFAEHAHHVGFLAFHYYPAAGLCFQGGAFCPPGDPNGTTDPELFSHRAYTFLGRFYSPLGGQALWHNLTGRWLPVLNSETNLNAIGGNTATGGTGTDPRQQTLLDASWLVSTLIEGADQNVTDLAYFALSSGYGIPSTTTAPLGGWGFGMSRESADNTDVRYAPYFALEMWSNAIPAGHQDVWTNSSAPGVVEAYAARDAENLSVVLVNRANVPVSVNLSLLGGNLSLGAVTTLDQRTYLESYDPSTGLVTLGEDGIAVTYPASTHSLEIDGYGVVTVEFIPPTTNPCAGQSNAEGGGAQSAGCGHPQGGSLLPLTAIGSGVAIGVGALLVYRFRRKRREPVPAQSE